VFRSHGDRVSTLVVRRRTHLTRCVGPSGQVGVCKCPYEAFVYSERDRKKIRKTFPTHAAAQAWRDDAKTAVRKRTLRASTSTSTTVDQAAEVWLQGAREGLIRNRKGDPYEPATIRAYEIALRLRLLPEIGSMRLSEVTRTDLQDLVDGLLAPGLSESAIGVTLLPLRAIYKRALARPETWSRSDPLMSAPICSRHSDRRTGRCGRPLCTQGCAVVS